MALPSTFIFFHGREKCVLYNDENETTKRGEICTAGLGQRQVCQDQTAHCPHSWARRAAYKGVVNGTTAPTDP